MTEGSMSRLCGSRLGHLLREYVPAREQHRIGTCLVLDADRTLALEDTGRIIGRALGLNDSIRSTFENFGYTDSAFVAVSDIWSTIPASVYREQITAAANAVEIYSFWIEVLAQLAGRVPVIVITAGVPQVWRSVLDTNGCHTVPVLGGCHRAFDTYVVTPETKAELVTTLQASGWTVVAAGDSSIDLPMLKAADVPLFVPDVKGSPGLREHLHEVPGVRQVAVDERRFEPLHCCSTDDVARMILEGGCWDAA